MKKLVLPIMLLAMLYFGSCQVKIPANDGTPPTTEIRIIQNKNVVGTYKTGDDQLVFPADPNKVYDIVVDGRDKGGVSKVRSMVTGKKVDAGGNEISFGTNDVRDRRILAQVLEKTSLGDFITIKTEVADYKGNRDTTSFPQVILTVGRVTPIVKLNVSKTRLTEGDTFTLNWTSQKAKELKFISPRGNTINIPKEKYKKGSVRLKATLGSNRYTLQATSHTGHTSSDFKALNIARKRLCKLVWKNQYNVSVIETVNGQEFVRWKEGDNGLRGNTNLNYKIFATKVLTSPDKKRGSAQMLRQNTQASNGGTTVVYTDYFDIYDLTKCNRPFRSVNFNLQRGQRPTRGSIGQQMITKNNKLLIQWITGEDRTNANTIPQAHGFAIVDMLKSSFTKQPDADFNFGTGSLLVTAKNAFHVNGSHSKVAVIYQSSARLFFVRIIDLNTLKQLGRDIQLRGFTGVVSAKVDSSDKLQVQGVRFKQTIDLK